MSRTPPRTPWLPPQQEALPRYFDALLRETWEAPADPFEPVDLVPPAEAETAAATAPAPDRVAETTPTAAPQEVHPPIDPCASWAAAPFEAQLFQVAGLTLALPASQLAGIVDSADLVAAAEGRVPWLRGRLCYAHGEIRVVDTAHWVLPPDRPVASPPARRYPVLIIANGRWGLACDGIGAVVTLDPGAVRWRSARTQRRWLAGMVGQPSCALLDPAQLAALFAEALAGDGQP